jgi:hypothetical protein
MSFTRVPSLFLLASLAAFGQTGSGPLTIATHSTLIPAVLTIPYSLTLSATGGTPPYTWFLPSGVMPPGLSLSPAGLVTGTMDTSGTFNVAITVTDNTSATATQTFSLTSIPRPQIRSGALPHVAAGGWWDTSITLINTSNVPIAVTVLFRADDGSPLSLPLRLTRQGQAAGPFTTAASLTAAMNPNGTMVIATGTVANTIVGWAEVQSTGPVGGFAILRSTPTNDKPSEASVPIQTTAPAGLMLPYDMTSGYVVGVALVNLASDPANISAKVWDEDGTLLDVQQLQLSGNAHTSFVLTDRLSATSGRRGLVQFQSPSGGVSTLGLRFSPAGPFANVNVILPQ